MGFSEGRAKSLVRFPILAQRKKGGREAVFLWPLDPSIFALCRQVRFGLLDLNDVRINHLEEREGSENMVRPVEGQVYLKVNFLFLGGGVLRLVGGCWGWGKGCRAFFPSGTFLGGCLARSDLQGGLSQVLFYEVEVLKSN